jgi:hypothetical protein
LLVLVDPGHFFGSRGEIHVKYSEATSEYLEATAVLPDASDDVGTGSVRLASYVTLDGETRRVEAEIPREHIALVLAHFADTMCMAGTWDYRRLEI